jgi:hypothetical protein
VFLSLQISACVSAHTRKVIWGSWGTSGSKEEGVCSLEQNEIKSEIVVVLLFD